MHSHCPLNYLAALVTKGCFTVPTLQVVVVVDFKTLPDGNADKLLCALSPLGCPFQLVQLLVNSLLLLSPLVVAVEAVTLLPVFHNIESDHILKFLYLPEK